MPNTAYLVCGLAERIYPSEQEGDYEPEQQTVASCPLAIPMLWLACFRPEDWKVATLKTEEGEIQVSAPSVERRLVQDRLKESVPRLESLFPGSGSFKSHAKAFRDTIASVHHAYRYLTIEWDEVSGMSDPAEFDRSASQILKFMAGEEVPEARDLLVAISCFDPDRKMPSVSAIAKQPDLPIEDWNNLYALAGCDYFREVLWIPKQEPKEEVVTEIVKAARNGDFASVWQLVEAGADLTIEDQDGKVLERVMNELARSRGGAEELRSWLQRFLGVHAKVNAYALKTSAGCSPLSEFTQLLKANGDPNAGSEWGFPVIMDACFSSFDTLEKVKLLVEAGADPNRRNVATLRSGTSTFGVLDRCVNANLFAVAEYVVERGFDPAFVERAYWEVRANKKGADKERWLKILEPHLG
jgi:hypothetical protein